MIDRPSYPGPEQPLDAAQHYAGVEAGERSPLFTCIQALLTALAVILLLASLSAHGESYKFREFQKQDGLENPNLHCLLQDHSGQMWMCSENGIYRFDGTKITRVPSFEGRDVPYITAAGEDGSNRLWIASYHQLIYEDAHGAHDPVLPMFGVQKITGTAMVSFPEDRNAIFFLADQVLYRVHSEDGGTSWHETPVLKPEVIEAHPELTKMESLAAIGGLSGEPGSRTLWVSCGKKLCEIDPDDGVVQVWGAAQGIPEDDWHVVTRDHAGRLWARGTMHISSLPRGSAHFVPEEGSLTGKLLDMRSPSVTEDPSGRILINVANGIARREGDDWRIFGVDQGLPPHLTSNLMFDRQGSFWFSVDGHGLRRWLGYDNWESWTVRDGLSVGTLWGLDQDRKGTMWVAAELNVDSLRSPRDKWQPIDMLHPMRQAQALTVDRRGHVWIGQATGAVLDYDPATRQSRLVAKLEGIYNFFEDPTGAMWVCGTKALFRLDASDQYTHVATSLRGVPFPAGGYYEGRARADGTLFFTGEKGLFQLKPSVGGLRKVELPAGIHLPPTSPLAIAKDGTLWVEGEAAPLVHLRVIGDRAEMIERVQMPLVASPSVYQLSIDHRGWLWAGTDRGMDVFNGHDWVGLTTEDGLVYDDTDSDSFHESPDGSIWIGTSDGMSHIRHPENIYRQDLLSLNVNNVRVGTSPIAVDGDSRVPWKKRGALTMDLSISNPSRAAVVSYRYRLEGLENEWQTTSDHQIRYSTLPPGKYRLAVMAVDLRRHQESSPLYLDFRLLPPWWRTTWFVCTIAVTLACLVGLISWLRVRALIAQQARLEELVRERTNQLELEKKELIDARIALVEQASRDGLTGLLNRSAIFDVLTTEILYANEKNTPLAIVLADLDHFKRINDTYGHQIGDAVLRECARRFNQATRPTDYVGRYGGEELLLIMPGLSQEHSMERLENLRATIAHELFDCEGVGLPVTCSFGVAWLDENSRSIKPLIALADQALYMAKTRGRNRVETVASLASGLFFPDGSGPLVGASQ